MIKKKKGSVTVFIMVFFVSLVGLIFAFITSSKAVAVKSTTNSLGQLWSNSILAEYDLNLLKRYNIFGFYGMPNDVIRKMNMYADYSFNGKKYIKYDGCSCFLYDYSLANAAVMKKQIVKVGKLVAANQILKPQEILRPNKEEIVKGQLNNKQILRGLPSNGSDKGFSLSSITETFKKSNSVKDLMKKTSDQVLETKYLFAYFKEMTDEKNLGDSFFQNEIEYVICGKTSDQANAESIKLKIIGIREALNFAYATKNEKMNAEALAAAELVTPGPAAAVTQKALLAAWALAESNNDYKLLINGKKVPKVKSEASWAIDLQSVIDNKESGYIDPRNESGEEYKDYLMLFSYAMDEDVRILRMMDIIQINMKYLYYSGFDLKDYNGGLKVTLSVNGDDFDIEREY